MHLVSRVLDTNNAKRVNLVTTSWRHSNFIVKFFSLISPKEERIIKIMSLPIRLSENPTPFFFFFEESYRTEVMEAKSWLPIKSNFHTLHISLMRYFKLQKGKLFFCFQEIEVSHETQPNRPSCQEVPRSIYMPCLTPAWRDLLKL